MCLIMRTVWLRVHFSELQPICKTASNCLLIQEFSVKYTANPPLIYFSWIEMIIEYTDQCLSNDTYSRDFWYHGKLRYYCMSCVFVAFINFSSRFSYLIYFVAQFFHFFSHSYLLLAQQNFIRHTATILVLWLVEPLLSAAVSIAWQITNGQWLPKIHFSMPLSYA